MDGDASVAVPTSSTPRRSPWRIGVPLILAGAGLLFTTTATTARGTDLRSGENARLVDLIRGAEQRNDRARAATERLAADVERLTLAAVGPDVGEGAGGGGGRPGRPPVSWR